MMGSGSYHIIVLKSNQEATTSQDEFVLNHSYVVFWTKVNLFFHALKSMQPNSIKSNYLRFQLLTTELSQIYFQSNLITSSTQYGTLVWVSLSSFC